MIKLSCFSALFSEHGHLFVYVHKYANDKYQCETKSVASGLRKTSLLYYSWDNRETGVASFVKS